ncbi:ribonuclease HIII [uncultured Limosilactobacillus sp.]|uniref:ribonuclease HIII n=1 Tax=uncultured Limosilactobacillus sp. TaxID=2837629 RepID=UPI0025D9968A|nr:ribonuclease HIII [uncultured Limosilactobacillus sp.]
MTEVLKFTPVQLTKLANYYSHNVANSNLPKGTRFLAKIPGVTITGYNSGKVMFQGRLATQEAARWQDQTITTTHHPATNQSQSPNDLPANFSQLAVLGSDEVGTGSYFGPLTTAAVFVDQAHLNSLRQLGVEDSKKLSDPAIIKMAKHIIKQCPYHVVNIKPQDYNHLIQQYNQAQLKAICHNYVLGKVLNQITPVHPDAILVDQFVKSTTYFRYLKGQSPIIKNNLYFKEKGETYHLAVAAASIVARYISLQTMDELSARAGMTLPIGAGLKVDQVAAKLLQQGKDLREFAKLHFANTKKAQRLAHT